MKLKNIFGLGNTSQKVANSSSSSQTQEGLCPELEDVKMAPPEPMQTGPTSMDLLGMQQQRYQQAMVKRIQRDVEREVFASTDPAYSWTSSATTSTSPYTGLTGLGTSSVKPFIDMWQFLTSDLYMLEGDIVLECNLRFYNLFGNEIQVPRSYLKPLGKNLQQLLKDINKGIANGKT